MCQCDQLIVAIWRDKGKLNVTPLSTGHPPFIGNVSRRTGAVVNVGSCPEPIIEYNKYMGGVDLADQLRSYYSMCRQSCKWWTYLFWGFFDTAIVYAYVLCIQFPSIHSRNIQWHSCSSVLNLPWNSSVDIQDTKEILNGRILMKSWWPKITCFFIAASGCPKERNGVVIVFVICICVQILTF